MKITSTKHFEKHVKKAPADIQKKFVQVYDQMGKAKKIADVTGIKKLKGFSTFFRIRIGNYRLGFELKDETIELLALLDRKEIYRFFP